MPATRLSDTLLDAKFMAPLLSDDIVMREGSYLLFARMMRAPVVTVIAPAGYGKSIFLAQYRAYLQDHGEPVSWLHLDSYDDGFDFWLYFCESFHRIDPSLDFGWVQDVATSEQIHSPLWSNRLINQLAEMNGEATLIIDDYQTITNNEIHRCLEYIIGYLPANVHLVISSREEIPFPLSRQRAHSSFVELDKDALAFSRNDTESYMNGLGVAADLEHDVEGLEALTQGWVLGIRLICVSCLETRRSPAELLSLYERDASNVAGVFDYFSEEILSRLPEKLSAFLASVSMFDLISADMCDYVFEHDDSASCIAECERRGLFMSAYSGSAGWHQMHALFRDFLRKSAAKDGDAEYRNRARRAACWLAEHGYAKRSIEYSIAAHDYQSALTTLERTYWRDGPIYSYMTPVIQLVSKIPYEELRKNHRCLGLYFVAAFCMGDGRVLAELIPKFKRDREAVSSPTTGMPRREVKNEYVIKALVAYEGGNYGRAYSLMREVLSMRFDDSYRLDGVIELFAARCLAALDRRDEAYEHLDRSIENARAHHMTEECLMATCELARMKSEAGERRGYEDRLREAHSYIEKTGYNGFMVEVVNFAEATSLYVEGHPEAFVSFVTERSGFVEKQCRDFDCWVCMPDFFFILAKGYFAAGDYGKSLTYLDIAKDVMKQGLEVPFLADRVRMQRLRTWAAAGQLERLRTWRDVNKERLTGINGNVDANMLLMGAFVSVALGEIEKADHILRLDIGIDDAFMSAVFRCDFHILLAYVAERMGRHELAVNQMALALKVAMRARDIQHLVDWGPWMWNLLTDASVAFSEDGSLAEFSQLVLDKSRERWEDVEGAPVWMRTFDPAAHTALTARQVQILKGICARKSSAEIAADLGLSKSTVQSHIHSLYRKIGAHTRDEAIEKGRLLLGPDI